MEKKKNRTRKASTEAIILPPRPELCQECNYDHNPKHPHNATTLYYQVNFIQHHKRSPTWKDAMAHCNDSIKSHWINHLEVLGIDVYSTHVYERKEKKKK